MSLRTLLRQLRRPGSGRRRATGPQPTDQTVTMLRPVDALVTDEAWCPAEQQVTLHAFLALGGRICWTCRHLTMTPVPPGGAE
ncbi:hypothetical protein [Streptomyces sp. NBC_01171]|uniref:hypothetical protein n=1 Tax=Streptomyces sp. NBC_01171 TaxID=2903757 RepID=UPI003862E097|nr:hypothetical protein OG448_15065 [Streptomyces sp. NBC_01171]